MFISAILRPSTPVSSSLGKGPRQAQKTVWGNGMKSLYNGNGKLTQRNSGFRMPATYRCPKWGETIKSLDDNVIRTLRMISSVSVGWLAGLEPQNSCTWNRGLRAGFQTEAELLQLKLGVKEQEQSSLRHVCRPSLQSLILQMSKQRPKERAWYARVIEM